MQFRTGMMTAVAGALLLTGCANWDVDGTAAMPNQGDAFAKALQAEYIDRARFEVNEEDWVSVDFFTSRAEMAAKGMAPAPQAPSDRRLEVDVADIGTGYTQLTEALAAGNAKTSPVACAKSQAWLEHWMEQAEEGHQADHIAWTRAEFEKVIPDCVNAPMEKPTFSIYFPFNSSSLTSDAKSVISKIVSFFENAKPAGVDVAGHADTVGSDTYNMKLGMKRASMVAKALGKEGVAPVSKTSYGESMLPKPTADGVKEQENRQVTVSFK